MNAQFIATTKQAMKFRLEMMKNQISPENGFVVVSEDMLVCYNHSLAMNHPSASIYPCSFEEATVWACQSLANEVAEWYSKRRPNKCVVMPYNDVLVYQIKMLKEAIVLIDTL